MAENSSRDELKRVDYGQGGKFCRYSVDGTMTVMPNAKKGLVQQRDRELTSRMLMMMMTSPAILLLRDSLPAKPRQSKSKRGKLKTNRPAQNSVSYLSGKRWGQ